MRSLPLCLTTAAALCATVPAAAATLHVPSEYATIQGAIYASVPGDVILVAAGEYHEHLLLPDGRALVSESGAAATTIDGDGLNRVIEVQPGGGPVEIRGFTIQGGFTEDQGAGINITGVSALLAENILRDHWAIGFGGALYAVGAQIEMVDNTFEGNFALEGACAYLKTTVGTVERNVFRDSQGWRHAGGVYLYSSSPPVRFNLFLRCASGLDGGGLDIAVQSNPVVSNNTFLGCSASEGGAIIVANETGVVIVTNNIITGTLNGYGLSDHPFPGSIPPDLSCNDFWNNLPGDYLAVGPGPGDISADPEFCAPESDDYRLMSSSPCAPAQQPSCGLIGAYDVGCGSTATERSTWGTIKVLMGR